MVVAMPVSDDEEVVAAVAGVVAGADGWGTAMVAGAGGFPVSSVSSVPGYTTKMPFLSM